MVSTQALPAPPASRDSAIVGSGGASFSRTTVRAFIFAALYFVAMVGVIELARFGGNVAPIWIASPILAWALIAAPARDWAIILGFAGIAHVLGAVYVGDQPATETVYFLANLVSPIVCASLLRWRGDNLEFEDRGAVLRFLLIAGIAAPLSSTLVVSIGTLIDPVRFKIENNGLWFLSDGLSFVVFLPIFRSLTSGGWRTLVTPKVRVRAALLFGILIVALISEWFMPADLRRSFPILILPYLVYMVFELGAAGARAALAFSTVGFLTYALFASEIARRGMPPVEYIFQVQIYLAAITACLLPLAAALEEKQKLYESASEALGDAQAAWGELLAAEAHFRLIADNADSMVMRLGLDGRILFASPACIVISPDVGGLEGRRMLDLAHPEDQTRVNDELAAFIKRGVLDHPDIILVRLKAADGGWLSVEARTTLIGTKGSAEEMVAVLKQVQP